jgi:hypothetical protein
MAERAFRFYSPTNSVEVLTEHTAQLRARILLDLGRYHMSFREPFSVVGFRITPSQDQPSVIAVQKTQV